jgi:hypothetical protein
MLLKPISCSSPCTLSSRLEWVRITNQGIASHFAEIDVSAGVTLRRGRCGLPQIGSKGTVTYAVTCSRLSSVSRRC